MISILSVLGALHKNYRKKSFKLKKFKEIKAVYLLTVKHNKCSTLEKIDD